MEEGEKNTRDSNFELLRILLIAMVLIIHYFGRGGAFYTLNPSDFNFYILSVFESFIIIAVDCFVIITGYYQINGTFKFKKIIELWVEVLFYSVTISIIFWFFGMEQFTFKQLLFTILPPIIGTWWFITLYIALYLCSPFINIALNNMKKEDHKKLLIILAILLVILPSVYPTVPFPQEKGHSFYNFVFLYCIGAYIRKYDLVQNIKINYLLAYILCSLFIAIGRILFMILSEYDHFIFTKFISDQVFNYNFFFVELSAICLFMFFKNLNIKSKSINGVASSVFGIYLIPDHPYIIKILYTNILHCATYYRSPLFIIHIFGSLIGIFTSCLIIDYFRKKLFKYLGSVAKNSQKIYKSIRIDLDTLK